MVHNNIINLLNFSNPVFASYVYWGAVLIIKCLFMSSYTGYFRFKTKVAASPEDAVIAKAIGIRLEFKTKAFDAEVERVRRAHLNDLENILPYLFAGLFYILTNPSVSTATLLFRVAAISRIVHTIVYTIVVIPQPARVTAFLIHYAITFYMAISVLLYSK